MTLRVACPAGHPVILTADKLGTAVACPHCLSVFQVESATELRPHARKEDKPRRARDGEDEDEKPQKKAAKKPQPKPKARKAKEEDDEEDEKPRKKKKASQEDEDEEEDEEEEEEEEEEEPIVWTPRKRQLNLCGNGLIVMMVAYCIMMGFSFFMMLVLDYFTFEVANQVTAGKKIDAVNVDDAWTWLFAYAAAPFLGLAQLVLLVGLVMSLLAVPAKVEGRGSLIGGIVLGGLVFLAGILIAASGAITDDPLRKERIVQLMGGFAGLCFVLGTLATMAYHGKILHFMNLRMEASQPITNTLFYFLYFVGTFVLFLAVPYICHYLHPMIGWVVILAIDAVAALAIRQLIAQAKMFLLAKRAIDKYIREA